MLVLLGIFIILIVLIRIIMRKEKREKETIVIEENTKETLLLKLKDIGKKDFNGYEGKSKEMLKMIAKKRNELYEEILNFDYEKDHEEIKNKVNVSLKQFKTYEEGFQKKIKESDELIKKYKEFIEFMREFYDKYTYYPHEFVHDTNRIQRNLEKLTDESRVNPLEIGEEYNKIYEEAKKRVDVFLRLHEEITELLKDQKNEKLVELKHELYMALSKADYKKVRILIKKIKKHD